VAPEVAPKLEAQAEAKFHMYNFVCANDLMKPHSPIQFVKMWHGMCTDPILRCFEVPKGLSNGDLLVSIVPEFVS
jgi:hypothetical protein